MPSREDQLTPISTMSPSGFLSDSISSGSSCATVGVYGHQPPSTPSPSSVANVRRIGIGQAPPVQRAAHRAVAATRVMPEIGSLTGSFMSEAA